VLEDAAVRAFARRGRLAIATNGSWLAIHDAGDGTLHDRCELHATIRVVRVAQAEDGLERVIVGDARGHVRIFAIEGLADGPTFRLVALRSRGIPIHHNAVLDGTLEGDVLQGEIRYESATNENPDDVTAAACVAIARRLH
jgi:hypothetical protein